MNNQHPRRVENFPASNPLTILTHNSSRNSPWSGIVVEAGLPALLVLALAILFFPGALLSGETLLPLDLIYFYQPFANAYPQAYPGPSNWILFDELLEFQPWNAWCRQSLARGVIPLWDPSAFCGYPFLAALQTGVLYPVDRLGDPIPLAAWPLVRALIHLLALGVGTALLARWLGAGRTGSAFAAVITSYCGFSISWLGHPHMKVWTWLPWLLLTTDRFIHRPSSRRAAACAVATGMSLLAGHIETSLHALMLVGLFAAVRLPGTRWRTAMAWLGAMALGCALAAAVIVPFSEYLSQSAAMEARAGGVWTRPTLDLPLMICLFAPKAVGADSDKNYWFNEFNTNEVAAGCAGWLPWLLAASIFPVKRRGRSEWALAALLFFSLSVSYGWPPVGTIVNRLPGLRMAYNFRFLMGAVLSVSLLAALGWDEVWRAAGARHIRRDKVFAGPVLFTAAAVVMMMCSLKALLPMAQTRGSLLTIDAVAVMTHHVQISGIFLAAALAALLFLLRGPRRLSAVLAIGLAAFELWYWFHGHNRSFPETVAWPTPPVVEELQRRTGSHRTLPLGQNLPPHTCLMYDFNDIRGNDALTPVDIERYLALVDPGVRAPDMLPAMRLIQLRRFASRLIDYLAVKYLVTCGPSGLLDWVQPGDRLPPGKWQPVFEDGHTVLWENASAVPRVFFRQRAIHVRNQAQALELLRSDPDLLDAAVLLETGEEQDAPLSSPQAEPRMTTEFDPHEVTVAGEFPEAGWVVLADTSFPGWTADIAGARVPIHRANGCMRAAPVPAGQHTLRFRYEPFSFRAGLFLTLTALLLAAALSVAGGFNGRA